jgi:probable HAF family extracellular repeat protein
VKSHRRLVVAADVSNGRYDPRRANCICVLLAGCSAGRGGDPGLASDPRSLQTADYRGARVMPVYTYTTLDDPSANNNTQAYGINASGQIVGEYIDASNHIHGFLYSSGCSQFQRVPNAAE